MKTAKKLMALFLTLAICFGLCVPALATNELGVTYQATLDHPELEVSTEEQTVVLTVKTNKTITLDGVGMEVYCDTGLELAKIENASLGFTAADVNILADKVTGRVSFSTSDAENTTTELLVTLTVTVPANTAAGTYKIGARGINMSRDYGEEWEDDGSAYATLTIKAAEAHVHTMVKTDAKASTCKEQGNNEYYTCTGCDKVYKDAEGKTETTVAAETLPLADHTWGEWTEVKAATETEKGLEERVCSVCGAKETRDIPVLAHTHAMVKTDAKASTCKEQGNNEYYTCTGCGKVFKDAEGKTETTVAAETLLLADHTWGEWAETKAATATEAGIETRTCSVCGEKETRETLPLNCHTITFDANGGEVETASALTGIDCKLASLPVPTRASYTFDGWFTAAEEGTEVTVDTVFDADATIYAHWTYSGGYTGGGSSGGSGGGGGGSATTYVITVESAGNGTVTADRKSASKGTTVTLAVKAGDGYELEDLTVTNASGEEISVTGKDGKYTFTMPASKVTVKAAFAEIEVEAENPFVDVAGDAYYADAVIWAAEEGITGGTTATTFSPNAACTRGQAVTFLWRAAGSPAPESSEMPFTDVAVGSYCYEAVLWAVEQGITKGTTETTFSPNDSCTRGQIVTFLWRAVGTPAAGTANPFEDVAAGSYCETAVLWAVENGVTNGTTASTFSPNATCTRAQIVTFLYRSVK